MTDQAVTGAPPTTGTPWRRLHPMTPVLRSVRVLLAVAAVVVEQHVDSHGAPGPPRLVYLGLIAVAVVLGVIPWWVTRWRLEGATLRIDSGLLRRRSRRFPLARVQAIDVVRPLLGRFLGVAELRLRVAGSGRSGARLAYLGEGEVDPLRRHLLALGASGLVDAPADPADGALPALPVEQATPSRPLFTVSPGWLLASIALRGGVLTVGGLVVGGILLAVLVPGAAAPVGGFLLASSLGLARAAWARLSVEWGFRVEETPDGLLLRCGLLNTRTETIPRGRVQALRIVEPLLWRPLGWCRVEVDVAGEGGVRRGGTEGSRVTSALLPVGSRAAAAQLVDWVLRYHHLAAGHSPDYVLAGSGRLRRVTDLVPLAKVQSLRWIQGPAQRRLGLATVHVDVAGRTVYAELRDRDAAEADALIRELPGLCRSARAASAHVDRTTR